MSRYINQWKLNHCPERPNIHSRLEEDLETAELVHRIQDRLSFLNISPSSNLMELIQQAVIFQEVTKSDTRKTEQIPKSVPDSDAEDEIESSTKVSSDPKVDPPVSRESLDGLSEEMKQKDTNKDSAATASIQGL